MHEGIRGPGSGRIRRADTSGSGTGRDDGGLVGAARLSAAASGRCSGRTPSASSARRRRPAPGRAGRASAAWRPCATSSFDVASGERVRRHGPVGLGQVDARALPVSRLIEPTAGKVLIDGEDVAAARAERLRELRRDRMSMVFQHFGLLPHRRVLDNVAFGLEVQGKTKAEPAQAGRRHARPRRPRRPRRQLSRRAVAAACSSGSGWPGPWPTIPRSCCSTSRSPRSTR